MFEVPDAKRVRRDELYGLDADEDATSHGQEDAAIRAKLNDRLSQMFSLDVLSGQSGDYDDQLPDAPGDHPDQGADEPAFEFRLFSATGSAPKVVVKDQDAGDGDVVSARPVSFHFKEEFTSEELERFREAAVEYQDIVRGALQRAWGLELSWRVTKITVTSGKAKSLTTRKGEKSVTAEESTKRKRPGKKRRIALRAKEKERKRIEEERKAKEEEAAKHRLTKEEHLREKKKRLNREKKLKRRQKEKEKKLAGRGGGDGNAEGASDDQSSSGSDGEDS